MKYLRKFKTSKDYATEGHDDDITTRVSYIKSDLVNGVLIKYGVDEPTENLLMWIDDYPDDVEDWDELFPDILDEPEGWGTNCYQWVGDTLEFDGDTYYLWEDVLGNGAPPFMLTSTVNYDTLYNMSIEDDFSNRNCPAYALLTEDKELAYECDYENENYVVLKVVKLMEN